MQLKRLFSTSYAKGKRNYLNSQKKYEIARTLLYFGISLALFIAGYIQTGERANLLTVVAVLGCLPASKSAVTAIMFCRFKGCSEEAAEKIDQNSQTANCLYDSVFTSYKKNFVVSHLCVRNHSVCGYSEDKNFSESEFYQHIGDILKLDGHKEVAVKIFTDLPKYLNRLEQMQAYESNEAVEEGILSTLKSVAL